MPAAFGVTDAEVQQMVVYVRSLGRSAPLALPGDARRGERLYAGKGKCANCHMLSGRGGRLGPDLSDIGEQIQGFVFENFVPRSHAMREAK